jgi:hypothetical protein
MILGGGNWLAGRRVPIASEAFIEVGWGKVKLHCPQRPDRVGLLGFAVPRQLAARTRPLCNSCSYIRSFASRFF